jgi:pimeloyl-ACP methyl ester carboxylesterase
VDLTTEGNRAIEYRLELPPEYHPHRSYPLLIALPNTEEDPKAMLARWSNHARDHGYILVVPRWADPLQLSYQGTEREQDAVPHVLRDVRRRFNVDPDRVFMTGFDQSGMLAYDVGLAKPDLFAGVVVFGAPPGKFGRSYKFNAQYLPFYVVEGQKSPHNTGGNRDLFTYWVERGFPSLYVEYGGRGLEFFPAELPYIFDWMARKRRARGLPELGGPDPEGGALGREFRTERQGDNRFYWLSSDDLSVGNNRVASITARIVAGDNSILVQQAGFKQLSVWLNSAMVDFEQPVEVRVNPGSGTGKQFKGRLTPDLRILLEDFYQRGDRRNLFVARVDFK